MHFRCHERQRKNKTQAVLKSSLKTSTDNLCGPSEEGLKKQRSVEVQLKEKYWMKEHKSKSKSLYSKSLIMAQIERWRQA